VCLAKYRRVVFSNEADLEVREVCLEIAKRYEIVSIEIGV
jgi:putative transposase